jgi:superfamily I DNA/RNA helicase
VPARGWTRTRRCWTSRSKPRPRHLPGIVDADTGETLSPLAAFLTHAALEAGDNQAQAGQDAVQLMTVHASKGLEFDACSSAAWKRACSRTKTP